jgi:hypothetical protein
MIKLLSDEERNFIDKQKVITMEGEILKAFNFDFNFISPLPFLERFMRLSELQNNKNLRYVCLELLKLVTSQIKFLDYRPSLIAAASYVMGLNILCNQEA